MATYDGNVSTQVQPQDSAGPVVNTISLSDLHQALRLGWEDFKAMPSHAIFLCMIYPVIGLMLARATARRGDGDRPRYRLAAQHPR